jgi:ATP-dependent phosphofructokinase / diphosphate-dependent phosphofructokinase
MQPPNVLVALGGGPSPVINASLLGVVHGWRRHPDRFGTLFAARHGIEGLLQEELVDLGGQDPRELELLAHTPASGSVGTCRYKLGADRAEDFERILEVLQAHRIGFFFYIGGNDSMDTADKVSRLAKAKGLELVVAGIPKTIDNDLGDEARTIIDHTPGYGSAARYWASLIRDVEEENRGMCVSERVAVLQAMGRKSGFLTAAARLADPERRMPLQLYFAESHHTLDSLSANVDRALRRSGRCIVVVNEGFDVGSLGEARDGFGHVEYGASRTTAAQVVVNHLNSLEFPVRGVASGQVPGVLQRSTSLCRSTVDAREAHDVAAFAVELALEEGTGFMATILREPDGPYRPVYRKVALDVVANSVRHLPKEWIAPDGLDVTDEFVRYATPLIGDGFAEIPVEGGLQRFARLDATCVPKRTKDYVPVGMRN